MMSGKRFGIWLLVLAAGCAEDDARGYGRTVDATAPAADTSVEPKPDTAEPPPVDTAQPPDAGPVDDGTLKVLYVDPPIGNTKGGDIVTVTGGGFVDGDLQLFFGPSAATNVFVVSSTVATCTTPPNEPGLVDVRARKSSTNESVTLELGYRYQSPITVGQVDPPEGLLTGGQPVTVSGSGFLRGVESVLFGQRAAIAVTVVDDHTIQLTTPAGDIAGPVEVRVTTRDGAAHLDAGFSYFELPRLDRVLPATGPVDGGTEVRLEGAGFDPDAVVRFGDAVAQKTTVESPSVIIAVTPPGPKAVVAVTVDTARGTGGLPNGFAYVDESALPAVALVLAQPSQGPVNGGTTVELVVYGLPESSTGVIARFGGVPAQLAGIDSKLHRLTVISPPGVVGPADLAIETPNGNAALPNGFTYTAQFEVLTVDPASGPAEGGTALTVFGKGFKGSAAVTVGALPCGGVTIESDEKLHCTTAAGSPGAADIRVQQGPKVAVLPDGFVYTTKGVALYAVTPGAGAQAGGTYVTLVGSGFKEPLGITFDGKSATHITVVSPTLATCRTPPGAVSTIDVAVTSPLGIATLPQSYTYFDPLSQFGGTWGTDVEGAVNVSVIDASNGAPLADAYVILDVNPDTPYQGYSNKDGQITLSGPDVLGTQMISASKTGYESSSVIRFDATNVTVALTPLPPPSSGPPPPSASVSGRVFGLGKYVVVPPGNCDFKEQGSGQCAPCTDDADCTGAASNCAPVGAGTFCTKSCSSDSACDVGFGCLPVAGFDDAQCMPVPGKRQARCYLSMGSMFDPLPTDETPNIVADDGTYEIATRLGENAVICFGGFVDELNADTTTNFTPVVFGVARHINMVPGPNPDHDVTLNHPLTRTISVRLDDPPYEPDINLEYIAALLYWDFGSDGGFMHRSFQAFGYAGFGEPTLQVPNQPEGFTDDVYDARFQILGMALALNDDGTQLPASFTLLSNLKQIETGSAYLLDGGQWAVVPNAVPRTVSAVSGLDIQNLWAVGNGGVILHSAGGGWTQQASPTKKDLYGVFAAAEDDAWAVGDGTILHFDGISWNAMAGAGQYDEVRAAWGKSPDDVWLAGGSWSGYWHWDGATLTKVYTSAGDLRAMHGSGDTIIAVGAYGTVRHFVNGAWTSKFGPTTDDLLGVYVVDASLAFAVGEKGLIWKYDGATWAAMASPTKRTLRAVWALSPADVYAVGDAATLLHYDGTAWTEQTESGKTSYTSLSAIWADNTTGLGVALGTSEVFMGPMLQVPKNQSPEDGGMMAGNHVSFTVEPGTPAHFNYITVTIPSMMGDTPVWQITTKGDVFDFDLPDFQNIEGTPGIGQGNYKLTIIRVYKDDFDIDNYDFSDLNTARWRSWAIDATLFSK